MQLERRAKRVLEPLAGPRVRRSLIDARDRAVGSYARVAARVGRGAAPGFIIIGAQKGGTTFLHQELLRHPNVRGSLTKELHYFDDRYARGHSWYLGHFPAHDPDLVSGEASPGYLFHPHVPTRVAEDLPDVKVIAVLRDPVKRAFSHYRHERRLGYEPLETFEEALAAEEERTAADTERVVRDPSYVSFNFRHFSYVARGRYAEQLDRWRSTVGPEQMLVLDSGRLYGDSVATLHQVHDFLDLERFTPAQTGGNDMAANDGLVLADETAAALRDRFAADNARLENEWGIGGTW